MVDTELPTHRLPIPLSLALHGLASAAVKLRAVAHTGDAEDGASLIGAMLRTLRDDLDRLRLLSDPSDRIVLAEEMAMFADDVASAASLLSQTSKNRHGQPAYDAVHPSERAARDVAFHSLRLAVALRCLGSPTISLAIH